MIDTREELIDALNEAAELEHGLMLQYLFAAFSIKRRINEGINEVQQARLADWEQNILLVAVEEMFHLAIVNNLLVGIGASPHYERPNFPQEKHYFPGVFTLAPLSEETLARFIRFEEPVVELPFEENSVERTDAIDPKAYFSVGDLYRQISRAFRALPSAVLFLPNAQFQDNDTWGYPAGKLEPIPVVRDSDTARTAIQRIIEDGEGGPPRVPTAVRPPSHYERFIRIRNEYVRLTAKGVKPVRNIAHNPLTRPHRDVWGKGYSPVQHPGTMKAMELFNDIYAVMLWLILQHYSVPRGPLDVRRDALRDAGRRMMSGILRPMAEILTELPISEDVNGLRAGPSFELYADLRMGHDERSQWLLLQEKLQTCMRDCDALTKETIFVNVDAQPTLPARLLRVHELLEWTLSNLRRDFIGGVP